MYEVVNRSKGPVQLIVRSKKTPNSFTTLNVPGIGAKKNKVYITDEQYTKYLDWIKGQKQESGVSVDVNYIPNQ